jgi:hypothetical protein
MFQTFRRRSEWRLYWLGKRRSISLLIVFSQSVRVLMLEKLKWNVGDVMSSSKCIQQVSFEGTKAIDGAATVRN